MDFSRGSSSSFSAPVGSSSVPYISETTEAPFGVTSMFAP